MKQTDVAHSIIFSRTEKFNATFIHKVWFGFQFSAKFFVENCLWRFSTKFGFRFQILHKVFRLRIVFILQKSENCLWRFSTKFGLSFPLSLKIFHLQISLIFLRKNRSEAFCGSSENILCATFSGFARLRTKFAFTFKLLLNFIDMPKL